MVIMTTQVLRSAAAKPPEHTLGYAQVPGSHAAKGIVSNRTLCSKSGGGSNRSAHPRRTNGAMVYEDPLFLCRKSAAKTPRLRRELAS